MSWRALVTEYTRGQFVDADVGMLPADTRCFPQVGFRLFIFVLRLHHVGHGERSGHFKLGDSENLSILAVNALAVNVLAVHRPLSLYRVSKSVFCTRNSVKKYLLHAISRHLPALRAFRGVQNPDSFGDIARRVGHAVPQRRDPSYTGPRGLGGVAALWKDG